MPFVTSELPGSQGILRADPEDFIVEEILAYPLSGSGEHGFVQIEKTGLTTPEAVERIAKQVGLRGRDFGFAGLKDKHARTKQWLSFPWPINAPDFGFEDIDDPQIEVLEVTRHKNKLKRSHGRGNRFSITIRDVPEGGIERAQAVLERLSVIGAPNRFGPQRFGRDGDNAERALRFVRGEERPPKNRKIKSLLLSALQSAVFNRVLDLRIERGLYGQALVGDVMKKHDTGGLFDVTDATAEQPRVDRLEISPTAALPGKKARKASGAAQAIEDEAYAQLDLLEEDRSRLDIGTRRSLRIVLDEHTTLEGLGPSSYRVQFNLPAGSYATVLLAELMKPESGVVIRSDADI